MNKVRIFNLFRIGIFCSLVLMVIIDLAFKIDFKFLIVVLALVYLPIGLIFNKIEKDKIRKNINRIVSVIALLILYFYGPAVISIMCERTFSLEKSLYLDIILSWALIIALTMPGVYDFLEKICEKITE